MKKNTTKAFKTADHSLKRSAKSASKGKHGSNDDIKISNPRLDKTRDALQNELEGYKSIQCVAFEIGTAPKDGKYRGLKNELHDVEARCNLMCDAILKASTMEGLDKSPSTLKVFMAPEFFFRGHNGAYHISIVGEITSRLQSFVAKPQWENWLFVFGSIVTFSKPNSTDKYWQLLSNSLKKDIGDLFEIYNYSFLQKGGEGTNPERDSAIVLKEFLSGVDFVPISPNNMDMLHVGHMVPIYPSNVGQEQQVKNYDGLSVLEICGLTTGVEICLDHSLKRLKKSAQAPGSNMLQMQLIPSCGMSIIRDSVAVGPNGLTFNVDGFPNSISSGRSALYVNGLGMIKVVNKESLNPDEYEPVVNVDEIFAFGPGDISIYQPVKAPKPVEVPGLILRSEYAEYPFQIMVEKFYRHDISKKAEECYAVNISAIVSNYDFELMDQELPIVKGSFGTDIILEASVVRGTYEELGVVYDSAISINFICGNDHVQGFICPFFYTIDHKKHSELAL